jgi:transcriptional regulator with PAS, ATPase and Fis domain
MKSILDEYLIGKSTVIQGTKNFILKASQVEYPILLTGETGVGKTLIAKCIHKLSNRKQNLFIHQNCSNLSETLFESELFGYEKGAFTGALGKKAGRIEHAAGGILFMDEIGDLSLQNQAKLLQLLEGGSFYRVGGILPIKVDIRIITATNKDLLKEIVKRKFRSDLFYRISVLSYRIPPLRERMNDIPLLVKHILKTESNNCKFKSWRISENARLKLKNYNFPGNIRELENVLKRACTFAQNSLIDDKDIFFTWRESKREGKRASNYSKMEIINALVKNRGNKTKTASELGISRVHLYRILNYEEEKHA